MKNFAERIKSLVTRGKSTAPETKLPIDFVKTKKGILKELVLSKVSGNAVGVYAKPMGQGMFITVVENIDTNTRNGIIEFSKYDMSGSILSRNELTIDEIEMVCPLNQKYRRPILNRTVGKSVVLG
jgi:hypothetical protein